MYKKNTDELYYFHLDVMGSLVAITDESGILLESRNYDPWGKPRNPQTLSYTLSNPFGGSSSSYTLRGYTFHEHYEMFDLINMNGRLYDNQIGQFINADPILADNENLQNYNRYSYVMNNPLKYTDPSGYVYRGGGGAGTYGSEAVLQGAQILSEGTRDFERGIHERQENIKNETFAFLLSSGAGPINPDVLGYMLPEFSTAPTKAKQSGTNFSWAQSLQQAGNYNPYYQIGGENYSGGGGLGWMSNTNLGVGAFGLANGVKTELIDFAIRSNYKSAQTWAEFSKLSATKQAWRTTNTLTKNGATYLKAAKLLSKSVFGITVINSFYNAGSAIVNDDSNKLGVTSKAILDITMGYIGFLGPVGFGISATYFIIDASGVFNSWSQPAIKR